MARKDKNTEATENTAAESTPVTKAASTESTPVTKAASTDTAEAATKGNKSIVDPKYRDRYKDGSKDWLAQFVEKHGSASVTNNDKTTTSISADKLFELARANNVNEGKVANLEKQKDSNGFIGRARMTVRNMLQPIAKQRHGLWGTDGNFYAADEDFLKAKGAPTTPTHNQDGSRVAAAKEETKAA